MKISELKEKHDHALTNWLKVIIFSLLMIAPLFASISQWVYISVNKNAKDSYSGLNERNTNLQPVESFIIDKKYNLQTHTNTSTTGLNESLNYIVASTLTINDSVYSNIRIGFYRVEDTTATYLYLREIDNNNNEIYFVNIAETSNNIKINFIFESITSNFDQSLYQYFNYTNYNSNYYLDNAFYYGVEKMTESDLFNWTQNTTLYSGIKTMTDNLEIQTPAIAILLTYWFILTIIYVIIDIVLKGFTTLTHLIMGAK